jgi:hypothetical protein
MVTPTTAPAITLFTNNHTEPTSSRIRDLAKTNNVGNPKKKEKKKKMNAMWLFKTYKNELHTNNSVAFNSITPASSRGPHNPSSSSSFFFVFPRNIQLTPGPP